METFAVLSPAGGDVQKEQTVSARVDTLEGKTVGEIWNAVYKGDFTFPLIRTALKKRFPGIKIVPYTEFPYSRSGDNPHQQLALGKEIATLAKAKGCDVVISGNGA